MQPSFGRVGVAQLIQPSEREDERLLDRIGGVFPPAKEIERVGIESGPVSVEQCAQGQAIAASCGMDEVGVRRMLIRRLVHRHVNKMRPQAKKFDGDIKIKGRRHTVNLVARANDCGGSGIRTREGVEPPTALAVRRHRPD